MGATVFEIAGGRADPPLVKGVGTKRLGKGRVMAETSFTEDFAAQITSTPCPLCSFKSRPQLQK